MSWGHCGRPNHVTGAGGRVQRQNEVTGSPLRRGGGGFAAHYAVNPLGGGPKQFLPPSGEDPAPWPGFEGQGHGYETEQALTLKGGRGRILH